MSAILWPGRLKWWPVALARCWLATYPLCSENLDCSVLSVSPIYCILHFLQLMQYTAFFVLQVNWFVDCHLYICFSGFHSFSNLYERANDTLVAFCHSRDNSLGSCGGYGWNFRPDNFVPNIFLSSIGNKGWQREYLKQLGILNHSYIMFLFDPRNGWESGIKSNCKNRSFIVLVSHHLFFMASDLGICLALLMAASINLDL